MATQEEVRRIALALPEATEEDGFTFRVAGKYDQIGGSVREHR